MLEKLDQQQQKFTKKVISLGGGGVDQWKLRDPTTRNLFENLGHFSIGHATYF